MKKNIILIALFALGFFVLYKIREPELKQHNKYQCAVYGYYEDCKTPLPPELRLK